MRLGLLLVHDSPEDTVAAAITQGFQSVEVSLENCIDTLTPSRVRDLHARCQEHRIALGAHAPASDLSLGSTNAGIRRESVRQISRAVEMMSGYAQYVTVHTGYLPGFSRTGGLERILHAVRHLLDLSSGSTLRICLENLFEKTLDQLLDYLRLVDDERLMLTLDIAHARIYGAYPPESAVRVLGSRVANIHASDTDGQSDAHLRVGMGIIDWRSVAGLLVTNKYAGPLTIEAVSLEDAAIGRQVLTALARAASGLMCTGRGRPMGPT